MFDFNMGVMLKMDMDRRMFNNVSNVANASIFKQIVRSRVISERYSFRPKRMREMICFTPIDVEEYQKANSMNIVNWVSDQFSMDKVTSEYLIKQITQKTLLSVSSITVIVILTVA